MREEIRVWLELLDRLDRKERWEMRELKDKKESLVSRVVEVKRERKAMVLSVSDSDCFSCHYYRSVVLFTHNLIELICQ